MSHPGHLLLHSGPCQSQCCLSEVLLFWLPCHLSPGLVTVACPECLFVCWWLFSEQGRCLICIGSSLLGAQSQDEWCARQPQPDLWGTAQLPVVASWQALWPCGSVPILPLWPTPKHGCVPCMVDGYLRGESRIYLVLGSSVLSKRQCPLLLHICLTSSMQSEVQQCAVYEILI